MADTTRIEVGDGKYAVCHEHGANLRAERHGEPWRDLTGDGLVLALAHEIEALRQAQAVPPNHLVVPAAALRKVLEALYGAPHLIRELVTIARIPEALGVDRGPVAELTVVFNTWARAQTEQQHG